jgi:hypothetical protein
MLVSIVVLGSSAAAAAGHGHGNPGHGNPAHGNPAPGNPAHGNSSAAHSCQHGGYRSLVGADGTTFKNVGACVSFAAHKGKFATGIIIPAGKTATLSNAMFGDFTTNCPGDQLAYGYQLNLGANVQVAPQVQVRPSRLVPARKRCSPAAFVRCASRSQTSGAGVPITAPPYEVRPSAAATSSRPYSVWRVFQMATEPSRAKSSSLRYAISPACW